MPLVILGVDQFERPTTAANRFVLANTMNLPRHAAIAADRDAGEQRPHVWHASKVARRWRDPVAIDGDRHGVFSEARSWQRASTVYERPVRRLAPLAPQFPMQ